jgi:hypothetical protein
MAATIFKRYGETVLRPKENDRFIEQRARERFVRQFFRPSCDVPTIQNEHFPAPVWEISRA